ncbi:MAG: NADH-quinone oxidoreductase subunit NuoE [Treponema sp.]|jgi:NADH-quinone oxidoreductase subunit E|nr:NADH-quinone oxidoreductase subunit NuoE [Treponema sp.]
MVCSTTGEHVVSLGEPSETTPLVQEAQEIVHVVGSAPEYAIPLLQEIQRRHRYLPQDLVEAVSRESQIPLSTLYGVATFYSQFRFKPQGTYLIRVCQGTACHVAGAELAAAVIRQELGIQEGETTPDQRFSLESVACLGCCSLAPVLMIGETIYAKLSIAKIKGILKEYHGSASAKEPSHVGS